MAILTTKLLIPVLMITALAATEPAHSAPLRPVYSDDRQRVTYRSESSAQPEVEFSRWRGGHDREITRCVLIGTLVEQVGKYGQAVVSINGQIHTSPVSDGYYGSYGRPHVVFECSDKAVQGSFVFQSSDGSIVVDNDSKVFLFDFPELP
ncbi:MAG: hypothetical protein IPM97_01260 [Bdellovibrionaceae bacterium]|nr:hypothetical protein [Pseudobdellovibrionaceae bacterium]